MGDKTSKSRKIEAGIPLGFCLSPYLFSVYINDMPVIEKSKITLFADDTIFYSTNPKTSAATNNL